MNITSADAPRPISAVLAPSAKPAIRRAAVADRESEAVGYLVAHRHLTFLANGLVVWVEEVMVDAAARGQGVGRQLMTAAESWAEDSGAAYVSLASRRSGAFYDALGYEDSATFYKRPVTGRAAR